LLMVQMRSTWKVFLGWKHAHKIWPNYEELVMQCLNVTYRDVASDPDVEHLLTY
jgi:hypothetical protein